MDPKVWVGGNTCDGEVGRDYMSKWEREERRRDTIWGCSDINYIVKSADSVRGWV